MRLAMLAVALVCSSCVYSAAASQVAPEYRDRRFQKLLIVSEQADLRQRQREEQAIVAQLTRLQFDSVAILDFVFAGDELTPERLRDIARESGADGILSAKVAESGTTEHYVPQVSYTNSSAHGRAQLSGNTVTGSSSGDSYTYSYGGYTASKTWRRYDVRLVDASNGQLAWVASVDATGGGVRWMEEPHALGRRVAERLVADGVGGKKPKRVTSETE